MFGHSLLNVPAVVALLYSCQTHGVCCTNTRPQCKQHTVVNNHCWSIYHLSKMYRTHERYEHVGSHIKRKGVWEMLLLSVQSF